MNHENKFSRNNNELPFLQVGLPEILVITSYPPRECGIATYSQDLIRGLNNKFRDSFSLKVCAVQSGKVARNYPEGVKYVLDTEDAFSYKALALDINADQNIAIVLVQHEFGLFHHADEDLFIPFLNNLIHPIITVFHTVLPVPEASLRSEVRGIAALCSGVVVMTNHSAEVLQEDYGLPAAKIAVIPHGTHLVRHLDKERLKTKYGLSGRKVLATFGLLSSGKGIATTLEALPAIISSNPNIIFLVIGKTHPGVISTEGEKYRDSLEAKVADLELGAHVRFVNEYLPLQELLEYLQLTDIYLFTSNDPNQAVSGTFVYALSCACPIISTPIPHAREVLCEDTGILIDFDGSRQMADGVNLLMGSKDLRVAFSSNTLQRIVPSAWENSAIAHALLFQRVAERADDLGNLQTIDLHYRMPPVKLDHVKRLTTEFGMIQFSRINQPDIGSGYTLDDNARALIAVCMHYEHTGEVADYKYVELYLRFMEFCQLGNGDFLNYVNQSRQFTTQNNRTNLEDANGRAIWALGLLIAKGKSFPAALAVKAQRLLRRALPRIERMHSPRAMAFAIKGLFYSNQDEPASEHTRLISVLADRLAQMYCHESEEGWHWYESYLTYANSILPEAMLLAWLETEEADYKEIALSSFHFLLSRTFNENGIEVISNKNWLHKGRPSGPPGEQPIDVAYTILALSQFFDAFGTEDYRLKMEIAFNWFLGHNRLHQIIYNPCTGGCYDGLEATQVNLNQGAESTVSYLMARLTMEKYRAGVGAAKIADVESLSSPIPKSTEQLIAAI